MVYKYVFAALTTLLVARWYYKPAEQTTIVARELKEYDYVVIGAGSAGSVVASRLSEDADNSVLILEAGKDDLTQPNFKIPLLTALQQQTEYDWGYYSTPQKHSCQGMINKQCYLPRGKVLGGSSNLNYMIYIRGNRHDYDRWAEMGATGWSYKDVLPYFIKSERNANPHYQKSRYHGSDGLLGVSDQNATQELIDAFLSAGEELGYPTRGEQEGQAHAQGTIWRGERSSTSHAFLRSAQHRPNLHIATEALVHKVLIEDGRAVGVRYERDGEVREVRARKEVILSAGAFNTPQLLMLSGIGPKKHLEELGIKVIQDLPVGNHLQDHLFTDRPLFRTTLPLLRADRATTKESLAEYETNGTGQLSTSGLQGTSFHRAPSQPKEDRFLYVQLMLFASGIGVDGPYPFREHLNIEHQPWSDLYDSLKDVDAFHLSPSLLHPRSRGTVRLRSTNPRDSPLVDPNFLEDERDVTVLMEALRQAQKFGRTKPFKKINAEEVTIPMPQCAHHTYDSDDYWRCHLRHHSFSIYHPTSSARIGAPAREGHPAEGVVDAELRVHGIQALRVADASIMPIVVSGNTNAACIMIGEKAADLIREKAETLDKNLHY